MDKKYICIGLDEAGRGCLAGPVVASAVFLPDHIQDICPPSVFVCITDSKKLSEQKREMVFEWLEEHVLYGVGQSSAETVDAIGIKKSNYKAMEMALGIVREKLVHQPSFRVPCNGEDFLVLIDGNDGFEFDGLKGRSIIKGDEKELCISAASIIAKVTRDRYMKKVAEDFPQYGFEKHKGYGTKNHIAAIEQYGICTEHRKSFEPIPKILYQTPLF